MQYIKIYDSIINRAKARHLHEYKEKHHIIPKCLGGSNEPNNLVELTFREHFICHWLLVKIYPNNIKLIYAFSLMVHFSRTNNYRINVLTSRHFELVKRYYAPHVGKWNVGKSPWNKGLTGDVYKSKYTSGGLSPPNMTGRKWINNGKIMKKLSPGQPLPYEWSYGRLDMTGNNNPMRKQNAVYNKKN